jgi:hypothetical protein
VQQTPDRLAGLVIELVQHRINFVLGGVGRITMGRVFG